MNRTKIEWTDYTWNPITGCKHGCWYCYARRMFTRFHRSFEPTFHPERLREPYVLSGQPDTVKVFVCSVADLFAPWTPIDWRDQVLDVEMDPTLSHIIFQNLTKNPERIPTFTYPKNIWIGTTVTGENNDWNKIYDIKDICALRFVSFEPLLGLLPEEISFKFINWVIIGKLTGSKRVKLRDEWIKAILDEADRCDIPVFMKNNLGLKNPRQEFPR